MSFLGFLKGAPAKATPGVSAIDAATARKWHSGEQCVFVDIREEREFRGGHIPGAQLAPMSRLAQAMPKDRANTRAVFYCLSGARTWSCAAQIAAAGFAEAYILEGGLRAWAEQGAPVEG